MQQCNTSNYSSTLFSRLILIFIVFCGACIGVQYISIPENIDKSLLFSICTIFSLLGVVGFLKLIKNNLYIYIILQSIFFWILLDKVAVKFIHISFRPESLIFALSLVAGVIFLFKNFNFLWQFIEFKFFTGFLIINIIYFFLYSTGFNISVESIPYGGSVASEKQPAQIIVFLSALSVFLSSIIAFSVFKDIKTSEQINNLILDSAKIFSVFFSLMLLCLLALGKLKDLSFHLSSPIYFIILLTFKYYFDNFFHISNKFNFFLQSLIITFFIISIFVSNKSSLAAFLVSLLIYLLINYKEKLKFQTLDLIVKGKSKFIILPVFLIFLVCLSIKFGLFALISEKISKIISGISDTGINSLYIRKNNWKYFMNYWQYHLSIWNTLFGFGLGKSREIIFYISAAQYNFIYRVQTVHNQFMEMFFDYGLMALFYYLPIIIIFFKNINNILNKNICKEIKLFSNMSILLVIFYCIYHSTDGLRVTTAIIFFSILIFIEGLNFSFKNSNNNKNLL